MKYQKKLQDNRIQCEVCPRECIIAPNQSGFCHIRQNIDDEIRLRAYGYNTGLSIDPIEKKPLYHFYPGSKILSFGTIGCNMGCDFCQNWHISRSKESPESGNYTSPEDIVEAAKKYDCKSIAFTYNDPVAFLEYAIDTAIIAQQNGIKTVAVTSGYINPQARNDFFKHIDAVNIDLKAFSDDFYKKHCYASLQPVLDTIKYVKENTNVWMELTTLLIHGENDSDEEIIKECKWIKDNIGVDVPLHFSAFFPAFKLQDKPPTTPETLMRAYKIAQLMGLKYVYTGNVSSPATSSTYCENCHNGIMIRNAYQVIEYHLDENGHCKFCGHPCDGRFE